jgi:putative ABC transport system permease protein
MRLYQWLLRLYPSSFRHEYGAELLRVFARRWRDAEGPIAGAACLAEMAADTIVNALRVHLDVLRQDLRQAGRALRRAPGFFVAAVVVTALGIGATTATFTLADHVLVQPFPFPEPDRLVKIWQGETSRPANLRGLQGTNDVSPANFRDWKAMSTSFIDMGAYWFVSSNLVGLGEPERLNGFDGTSEALKAVGVLPALGRPLLPGDDAAGAPCALLVSDAFWRRKLGGDRSAVGRVLRLDGEACTVVGVMPSGYNFPTRDGCSGDPFAGGRRRTTSATTPTSASSRAYGRA